MTRHLYYHNDLDGHTAGAIAYQQGDVLHERHHDHYTSPANDLHAGDEVVIVDYSFKADDMLWLQSHCNVIWIDHHISAIRDSKKFGYDTMNGIRKVGPSGAELAWTFFMKTETPEFVTLVGEYDTFRTFDDTARFRDEVVPFFYGAELNFKKLNPGEFAPSEMTDGKLVQDFIRDGKIIQRYKLETERKLYDEIAYVKELWGYRCLCVNTPAHGTLFLTMTGVYDPAKHDLMFTYSFNDGQWSYGWYTNGHPEVDVSKIAKMYGGGGHASAAGACSDNPIAGIF